MTTPYEDILTLPYPFPSQRRRMSMADRAAQFAPFAALSGFSESITAASSRFESSFQKIPDCRKADFDSDPLD